MLDVKPDWCGEHLIRCAQRNEEPEIDVSENALDLRRKKVAKLVNMHLTAPEIARRLGVSDSVVYKDAARMGMRLTGAKVRGLRPKLEKQLSTANGSTYGSVENS
jgi:allophanate hydrolase subunit 2